MHSKFMNMRFLAIQELESRGPRGGAAARPIPSSEQFATSVFHAGVMRKMLSDPIYKNVMDAMESRAKIRPEYADAIALAMKEWAMSHGATHYTHWFQPLTGGSAQKHDAFMDWAPNDTMIEQFSGKQLLQGEPDASSFPSGGLRSTYEARGYTGWDPTSPAFLWKAGDGVTLCIPSVFFSWTGEVLDNKIPLLRSDIKLNEAVMRLLRLTSIKAERVYSTIGLEQEYFVVDRALCHARPDLVLLGKTVFGAPCPKGQELKDHYLCMVKDRILAYMRDFEIEALRLGIPVKTRHNEVAPAQHEVAPVFEKASRAVDHNLLLMELMRHIAVKHELSCLLHEKPFARFNGSGKHVNWSLSTDGGMNLLDPTDSPGNNLHFLILLTAILHGVHSYAPLLRASIGSYSNDARLGGHEAPPAIISVYLGQELETILDAIEQKGGHTEARLKDVYDLGLLVVPDVKKDNTDRNRTSPFAFTGNKFEFRAVGSSASPAFSITVLNALVARSLGQILDEIEGEIKGAKLRSRAELAVFVVPVLQKYLKLSRAVRYSGDNYSEQWSQEANRRGLANIASSFEAFDAITAPQTIELFQGILTEQELASRAVIAKEQYGHILQLEIDLMVDLFYTEVLPAAMEYQKGVAKSLDELQKVLGKEGKIVSQRQRLILLNGDIEKALEAAAALGEQKRAKASIAVLKSLMDSLREHVDRLEQVVEDRLWPLPKYRELLFLV